MTLSQGDLTVIAARVRMLAAAPTFATEPVALTQAQGRVLASAIVAIRDQPPFDFSAMDGWAVNGAGDTFQIIGESAAGRGYFLPLPAGQAVRVFTGAPVPPGTDRIIIQEEARREGDILRTSTDDVSPDYIRKKGRDFRAGAILLQPGVRLDAWRLSIAAAAGCGRLTVAKRPKVALLCTGDELVAAGATPQGDQIFDSVAPALSALVESWGGEAICSAVAGDNRSVIQDLVRRADCPLIVTIGGASVGDHDLVKPAVAELGLELRVDSVKLRPGKPTWFGVLPDARCVLGLPGNPASALVCAELFLRPLLMKMQGADPDLPMVRARLASALPANGAREHWARAKIIYSEQGLFVQAMTDQDSSLVSVFAQADALIRCPSNTPVLEAGAPVELMLLNRL